MKAAFLFSGQLRGFPHCVEAFKRYLFSAFDSYDTFFHLPNIDGKVLFDIFDPTAVVLEKDQTHPDIPGFENNICRSDQRSAANQYQPLAHMQHYFLQWYGVQRVFNLFENYKAVNNTHYDAVFRIRPDMLFYDNYIHQNFDGIQIPDLSGSGGIYDRLAVGSYNHMKYYCSLYTLLREGRYNNYAYTGNSESKLRQHLEQSLIPITYRDMKFYQSVNKDGTYSN